MPANPYSIALISEEAEPASTGHTQRIFREVADFARATELEIFQCDCVLLDIRVKQQDNLQALSRLAPAAPVMLLLDKDTQFSKGYPFGCNVADFALLDEVPSALFNQRLQRAISQSKSPLDLDIKSIKQFSKWMQQ